MIARLISLIGLLCITNACIGAEYDCPVNKKLTANLDYSKEKLDQFQFRVEIKDDPEGAIISRCSYAPSKQAVTCDRYNVDRVETDPYVKIKKFYVFRSQFDVQIFTDLTFIENNGRGDIAFGTCRLIAP